MKPISIPKKAKTTEVRDVIHGSIELYPWEIAVIDSDAFQRLRNIKQLGFSEFAYPCAVHNRYIHSIGACHLAGMVFQSVFKDYFFSSQETYHHFFYLARVCALLHDIGHGPFSHAIENAMPDLSQLKLPPETIGKDQKRQATHEDYTLKIVLDSSLTKVLEKEYARFGITPWHIASVMNLSLKTKDHFFHDRGIDFRKIMHQIISSEVDADRMDYLQRDSYYTGVSYGQFDSKWLLTHLGLHIEQKVAYLSINDAAIYTFEDFLLSRYHMFMMVYLHHKSVCYEMMMGEYLNSKTCTFQVPADIEKYLQCDDSVFMEFLRKDAPTNDWAMRILHRRNHKVVLEIHESRSDPRKLEEAVTLKARLKQKGIPFLEASSGKGLSNYVKPNLGATSEVDENTIFVESVSRTTQQKNYKPLVEVTDLFRKYADKKHIYRIYVPTELANQVAK